MQIWRKLICCFKTDKNLVNFYPSTQASKIYTLIGPLHEKYVMFDLKKYSELSFMTLESDTKFEEKLTCGLENNMRNLPNFYQSTWKLGREIGTFMGYFYPK